MTYRMEKLHETSGTWNDAVQRTNFGNKLESCERESRLSEPRVFRNKRKRVSSPLMEIRALKIYGVNERLIVFYTT